VFIEELQEPLAILVACKAQRPTRGLVDEIVIVLQ
jgi:hypothetical protein